MLVVILALVNVSATVLRAGSRASLNTGMLGSKRSIQDRLVKQPGGSRLVDLLDY
jgi:hypothetical protein